MSSKLVNADGVFTSHLHKQRHEGQAGRFYHTLDQPSRRLILERNAELRKNKGVLKDLSFGRQLASIPLLDYYALQRKFPKLKSTDGKERSEELMRVLRMPEYKPLVG